MNERIKEIADECGLYIAYNNQAVTDLEITFFAEMIAKKCANICMELAAKCAGLPYEGALAIDCANLIKQDFGVEE